LSEDQSLSGIERLYHDIFTSLDPAIYKYSARAAHISGLLYPSIAAQNKSNNLAVKADFVETGLRLVNASFHPIKEIKVKTSFSSR
jgi:hypothetical protein